MADFTPITKISTNIKDDLRLAASDRKISPEEVDFDLLSYETYCKRPTDIEWETLSGVNIFSALTTEEIYSEDCRITQEYQIRIRPAISVSPLDLRFSLAMNKTKGILTAIIDPSSIIPLKKGVQEWIKTAVNKKKLRLGYLIGTADDQLDKEILRLLARLQKNGPLSEPYPLQIAHFYPAINPINDAVILHYKQGNEEQEEPSLIQGVNPGDLVMEYIFPKDGRSGRGLDGAPIIAPDPIIKYAEAIKVNDTIYHTEDERSIRYFAAVSGFIKRVNGVFVVSQDLRLESVNAKTGSILPGADKDITLTVQQRNAGEDAVAAGLKIDIQTVDISGTVGENVNIKACDLNVDAQTHKKCIIDVTGEANIKLHRGDLRAHRAKIEVLEGGTIIADVVHIGKMLGGEIIAREVHVNILYAHSKITALESIEVHTIEGEGHILAIDPLSVPAYHTQRSELIEQIQEKTTLIQQYKKELSMKQIVLNDKGAQAKRSQQRIIEAKNAGREPLETDTLIVRQYRLEAEKLQVRTAEVEAEEKLLYTLHDRLKRLEESDIHATIKHHSTYQGHTRILFIDPMTQQSYTTFPNGIAETIRLQEKNGDKVFVLN